MQKHPELKKKIMILSSDDGSDWSARGLGNVHDFGRFWDEEGLERLIICKHAPGLSRYRSEE